MSENHSEIINHYTDSMKNACTFDEMKSVAVALLSHVAYLLGRESMRAKNNTDSIETVYRGIENGE